MNVFKVLKLFKLQTTKQSNTSHPRHSLFYVYTCVPVVFEQSEGDRQEGQEEVEREEVFGAPGAGKLQQVEEEDGGCDDR